MKKKSLLIAVAAMGLVAAGTAGVSTFAWYQASSRPTVSSAVYESSAIATTQTSMEIGNVNIEFTIEDITGVQLSKLTTIATVQNTLTKGSVTGTINKVTGQVTDGEVHTEAVGSVEVGSFVKQYVVTAEFENGTTADKIAQLAGYHVEATLTAEGHAKLRGSQALTGADDTEHTLTVSFDGTSTISVTGNLYVRIDAYRTGSDYVDLVSDHEGDKLTIAALSAVTPTQNS